jgi:predicted ArsR family transcriptional regulator
MPEDDLAARAGSVGALAEPARRALYRYVAGQSAPVSREQAAAAVDLPLHSVKFHLDQLVEKGLLEVEFRRLSGRTGPGAGRPSKLYQRSAGEVSVSLPERRYDLAGDVLATAVDRCAHDAVPIDQAVREAARETGRRIGTRPEGDAAAGPRDADPSSVRDITVASAVRRTAHLLADYGYEPQVREEELCLTNCPFDRIATEHTELVCGMNLALIEGVLDGLAVRCLTPRLAPTPGLCCVRVAS